MATGKLYFVLSLFSMFVLYAKGRLFGENGTITNVLRKIENDGKVAKCECENRFILEQMSKMKATVFVLEQMSKMRAEMQGMVTFVW